MTKTKAYRKTNTKAKTQTKKKKLLVSKQTLVSRGVAGFAVCHFSAELNGRREIARK